MRGYLLELLLTCFETGPLRLFETDIFILLSSHNKHHSDHLSTALSIEIVEFVGRHNSCLDEIADL